MKVIASVLFFAGVACLAQQPEKPAPRAVSLEDCVQQALQHNLDLQIERINPRLSLYSLRADYAGYDPVFSLSGQHDSSRVSGDNALGTGFPRPPTISDDNKFISSLDGALPWGLTYGFFGNITETYGSSSGFPFDKTRGAAGVNLTQPLLKNFWIDSTRLNISVAKNRLKYSESGLRLKIMDIVTQVEQAYYELIAARENVKVRKKALELAQQLLAENKKRVEVGTMAPLDEKQAQSQFAAARADLVSARQTLASQQNALKSLLTDNYRDLHDTALEPAENLSAPAQEFSLQDSWRKGVAERPDLHQAKLDLEQSGIQLRYDRNQLFPQLDLFGTYGHSAGGAGVREFSDGFSEFDNGNQPFHTYGVKLTVPLSHQSERNRFKSAKLSVEQSLLAFKKLEQGILAEIDNAIIAAQAGFERVDATRAAREYAEAALDAEQKKLENGKSTSFFVLQLQKNLTDARSQEIRALADYNKALASLAKSEGSTLDRRAINVQVK